MSAFVPLRNGEAAARDAVPVFRTDAFRSVILDLVEGGGRVKALFAVPRPEGSPLELWAVIASDREGRFWIGRTRLVDEIWPSLTPDCPQVHLFERELAETWGVLVRGHPWMKPVRFAPPLRAGWPQPGHEGGQAPMIGVTDFFRVEGEEVHEVAVGPVHAGVIEPGHFRFQCHGETVFHLEISLGYQHRGVERSLVGGPDKRTLHTLETAAGDTSVGHASAYAMLREGLASGGPVAVPERGQVLRGIALELERLANHTGDLGALAGDVGFLPTQAFCGRLRGDWLNLSALLCGNRFGRSMVRPGGVGWDADADRTATMRTRIDAAFADLADSVQLLWDAPSVMGRFEETGRVTEAQAAELGLVGMAARACGLDRDSRREFATGPWAKWPVAVAIWPSGDVYARAMVRWMECERSVAWMRERLDAGLPEGPVASPCAAPRADHVALAVCEGWRGEVLHVAVTDGDGRFLVYKVVDPSFHNWTGLALALRGQQISDFPLCNKSFNLSYCGHDL